MQSIAENITYFRKSASFFFFCLKIIINLCNQSAKSIAFWKSVSVKTTILAVSCEKVKILLVCSEIITYLHNQSERKKIHIFKIIYEKFLRLHCSALKWCISSMNYKNSMHFGIQLWKKKISVKKKISKFK